MFGAAVRADGSPSPSLARRVGYALAAVEADPGAMLFLSGGVGRHGPSEASVMARLLGPHVAPDRLHLDEAARDTLESVRHAAAFARRHGLVVWSCTDAYHQPRALMLFRLFGVRARPVPMASRAPGRLWWRMAAREVAALPYDLVAGLWAARIRR